MNKTNKLHFGFYEDFKTCETLLFWGTVTALKHFSDFLELCKQEDYSHRVLMNDLDWTHSVNATQVYFELDPVGYGLIEMGRDSSMIEWNVSKLQCKNNIAQLEALIKSQRPGHHYFEGNHSFYQVIVSKGEYEGLGET